MADVFDSLSYSIIPPEIDFVRAKTIVDRVLAESPLEELDLPSFDFGLDLSRLSSLPLQRLAIDSSMLHLLPSLPDLEELVLKNIDSDDGPLLQRFRHVSTLTLSGSYDAIHDIDASGFNRVNTVITAPTRRLGAKRDEITSKRSFAATGINLVIDSTWTNESLNDAVCSQTADKLAASIAMDCTRTTLWFRLPNCVSDYGSLQTLAVISCQMPPLGDLPLGLISISLIEVYGSWTHAEAGTAAAYPDDFDWDWLGHQVSLTNLTISDSPLKGTLPNHITHSALRALFLATSTTAIVSDRLSGTINPNWFSNYPSMVSIDLSGQALTGDIPTTGLGTIQTLILAFNKFSRWPVFTSSSSSSMPNSLSHIDLGYNNLTVIPSETDFLAMPLEFFVIRQNPNLNIPFPNLFNRPSTKLSQIGAESCQFTGPMPEITKAQIDFYVANGIKPSIFFYNNSFSGTIPSSWSSMSFSDLNLLKNPGLTGQLAIVDSDGKVISQVVKDATSLHLSSSLFNGHMFNISTMTSLTALEVEANGVDFCAAQRLGFPAFPQNNIFTCTFTGNATMCNNHYPSMCTFIYSPPPTTPSQPPLAKSCPIPSPGSLFICKDGIWLSEGSVTEETLILPGDSTTVILGNLSTSTIVTTSISSLINVTGCITNPNGTEPVITIVLTQSDLEKIIKAGGSLTAHLIQQSSSCSAISALSVNIDASAIKSCKKIKTDKIGNSSGFAATFTVSSSGCNTWWIILVSVVCGVILIAVIIVVVLAIAWPSFRAKIRPFSRGRTGPNNVA